MQLGRWGSVGNKTKPIKNPRDLKKLKAWLKENDPTIYVYSQVALATGYRAGDLVRITVGETREALEKGYFTIIEQKKEKKKRSDIEKKIENKKISEEFCEERFKVTLVPRRAKIKGNLRDILEDYIEDKKDWEYLFKSPKNSRRHISVKQTCRVINRATKECDISIAICNHGLRKTYGYIIYKKAIEDKKEASYGLLLVQKMYCHSNPDITRAYIGLDEEEEDEVLLAIDDYIG